MSSSAERFWKAVGKWERDQPQIVIECSFSTRPPKAPWTFIGKVMKVTGKSVIFADVETGEEHSIDFAGAEIRVHSFERLDAVGCFSARWEEDFESVMCLLTELREFGKPN